MCERNLPNISFSNFKTLGPNQWLDDEIINYFITKWCLGTSTLGLNTFFACKILFEDRDDSCVNARSGLITLEDERKAVRWCRRANVSFHCTEVLNETPTVLKDCLGLQMDWDSIFIPINENHSHWYSAYIDFRHKHIHVYDSWGETCRINKRKPVLQRKNAGLMLVRVII